MRPTTKHPPPITTPYRISLDLEAYAENVRARRRDHWCGTRRYVRRDVRWARYAECCRSGKRTTWRRAPQYGAHRGLSWVRERARPRVGAEVQRPRRQVWRDSQDRRDHH